MTATTRVTLTCDHLGCEAIVEGRDAGRARNAARHAGWLIAVKRGSTFRDFCTDHRWNRSFYG